MKKRTKLVEMLLRKNTKKDLILCCILSLFSFSTFATDLPFVKYPLLCLG